MKVCQHVISKENDQARLQTSRLAPAIFTIELDYNNGVNFREDEGWIQSENEKNIDHQLEIGVDQSI